MAISYTLSTDNSTVLFNQHFKTVKKGSILAATRPDVVGKKRETVEVSFPTVKDYSREINTLLNETLVSYAKQLIADNDADWNYIPSPDDITLEAAYQYLVKPSNRGFRILTKANISTWAAWFSTFAVENLSKSQGFAVTVTALASDKFSRLSGMPTKIQAVKSTLIDDVVIDAIESIDGESAEIIQAVHIGLIDCLTELETAKGIDLDDLL